MAWRLVVGAALLLLGLAACSNDQRLANISDGVPKRFSETKRDPLLHTIEVGEVRGGASLMNTVSIRNEMFATILKSTLERNALLAAPGAARWRVEPMLDFEAPLTSLGDQTVKAKIRYVLRDVGTGEVAFDKVVETSGTRETMSAGAEIALFALAGVSGSSGMASQRRAAAYDIAVGNNLNAFLDDLATWGGGSR